MARALKCNSSLSLRKSSDTRMLTLCIMKKISNVYFSRTDLHLAFSLSIQDIHTENHKKAWCVRIAQVTLAHSLQYRGGGGGWPHKGKNDSKSTLNKLL